MSFVPVSIEFFQAIKSNNAHKAEELILNSDSKRELINEYVTNNGKDSLINLLPMFKSRGLVLNINSLLDI